MTLRYFLCICLLPLMVLSFYGYGNDRFREERRPGHPYHKEKDFIATQTQLKRYYNHRHVLLIASPGRSGSTLLTDVLKKYATNYQVLKTHLLPPNKRFQGKILFIYSNPDKAAESACRLIMHSKSGGATHFYNVQTSDQKWFSRIGRNGKRQNETHNLLAYDALGCDKQLEEWLHEKTLPCDLEEAQILAIKYENLWDLETRRAIKHFLKIGSIQFPPKKERGCQLDELSSKEIAFKAIYNMGTEEQPIYQAYDRARELWEQAPPFQFLKLMNER